MESTVVEVASNKQFVTEIPDEPVLDISSLGEGLSQPYRKTIELTAEAGQRFLEMPEFAGDRPLNDSHVIFLMRQMRSGTFRWEQVQIITCTFEGKEYRMNGQHTALARIKSEQNGDLPKGYRSPVTHLRYIAKTEHDMRQLYASIDRGKSRTNANVLISYLMGHEKFNQFNKQTLKILGEALSYWKWENESQRQLHPADDRAYLMLQDDYQLTTRVGNFLNSRRKSEIRHMFRRPVVAAMFATFNVAPDISLQFWDSVATGEMLKSDDPRKVLRDKLATSSIAAGGDKRSSDTSTVSSEEMFRHCIIGWNSFRKNMPLKVFNVYLDKPRSSVSR